MDSLDYYNLSRRISALEREMAQRDAEMKAFRTVAADLVKFRDAAAAAAGTPRVSV